MLCFCNFFKCKNNLFIVQGFGFVTLENAADRACHGPPERSEHRGEEGGGEQHYQAEPPEDTERDGRE